LWASAFGRVALHQSLLSYVFGTDVFGTGIGAITVSSVAALLAG
jgi:uncharacterized membrane protein